MRLTRFVCTHLSVNTLLDDLPYHIILLLITYCADIFPLIKTLTLLFCQYSIGAGGTWGKLVQGLFSKTTQPRMFLFSNINVSTIITTPYEISFQYVVQKGYKL